MELHVQRRLRETNGDLAALREELGLNIIEHPTLPLVVFNYAQRKTPRRDPIGLECRGLVLERPQRTREAAPWRVIAKSMDRFFNYGEGDVPDVIGTFNFAASTAQTKEDGSLLVLYYYAGRWMLNSKSAFMCGVPEGATLLMAGLYDVRVATLLARVVAVLARGRGSGTLGEGGTTAASKTTPISDGAGAPTEAAAVAAATGDTNSAPAPAPPVRGRRADDREMGAMRGLADVCSGLDPAYAYTLEFCSRLNRVVRDYPEDRVVLLTAVHHATHREMTYAELDTVARKLGAARPAFHDGIASIEDAQARIAAIAMEDPAFEGFVLHDAPRGLRVKLKSPSYFFLHHITFDRLQSPGARHLVPYILAGEGAELFSILRTNGLVSDLYEVQRQWDVCKARLDTAYAQLLADFDTLAAAAPAPGGGEPTAAAVARTLHQHCRSPVKVLLKNLSHSGTLTHAALDAAWRGSAALLTTKLFSKAEQKGGAMRRHGPMTADAGSYVPPDSERYAALHRGVAAALGAADTPATTAGASTSTTPPSCAEAPPSAPHPAVRASSDGGLAVSEGDDATPIVDAMHETTIASRPPEFDDTTGAWRVWCVCGGVMALYDVPAARCVWRCAQGDACGWCGPAGVGAGPASASGRVYVYQCPACLCIHGAHQVERRVEGDVVARPQRGKPLGVPCSHGTLCLRHRVHEAMASYQARRGVDKQVTYRKVAAVLGVPRGRAHIALMNAAECRVLIRAFEEDATAAVHRDVVHRA